MPNLTEKELMRLAIGAKMRREHRRNSIDRKLITGDDINNLTKELNDITDPKELLDGME